MLISLRIFSFHSIKFLVGHHCNGSKIITEGLKRREMLPQTLVAGKPATYNKSRYHDTKQGYVWFVTPLTILSDCRRDV